MAGIKSMNGKPLIYEGFADFDDPHRALEIGKHTTLEAFEAKMRRSCRHGVSVYGWVWVEYSEERTADLPRIVKKVKIFEPILPPFRMWVEAKRRAQKERSILSPALSWADCCMRQIHCQEDHQLTARHFRYWCLQNQVQAVDTWPWLKETIAEEVLTCR